MDIVIVTDRCTVPTLIAMAALALVDFRRGKCYEMVAAPILEWRCRLNRPLEFHSAGPFHQRNSFGRVKKA